MTRSSGGAPASTSPSRLLLLSALGALLGLVGGGAAWVLVHLIGLLTNLTLFHRWAWDLPSFEDLDRSAWLVVVPVAGAAVVSLLARWAPIIRGHGIPEAMEAVLLKQSRIAPRTAIAKPISAAVAIGTGGPFGAEGPIIVTGGALGSLIGQIVHVSPAERKILLASGAAAGMAATFGAPLASVVLAIELLLFEFSTRSFVPLVLASSVAAGVHSLLFGVGPLFTAPEHGTPGLEALPIFAVLGLASGLLAVIVSKGLFVVEAGFRRLPWGEAWHPIIGAVGFGLVGLLVPRALGVGYDVIDDLLATRLAAGAAAGLLVAKLVAWWLALGSGTSGGTLAPVLIISAAFGSLVGSGVQEVAPGLELAAGTFAVVAMAATFGAATRATFTSIVFVFELTRDYELIVPVMLASVLASLVTSVLLEESLMTEKLARRGLRVRAEYEPDVFRSTTVSQVMSTEVATVQAGDHVESIRAAFLASGHGALPIVDDDGHCCGIVSRGDLPLDDADGVAVELGEADVVAVTGDQPVLGALQRIVDEGVSHVPVVDGDGRLVGIVTRTDLLRARWRQQEAERLQRGWRPGVSRQGASGTP